MTIVQRDPFSFFFFFFFYARQNDARLEWRCDMMRVCFFHVEKTTGREVKRGRSFLWEGEFQELTHEGEE
jgi:hypothetical protein